MGDHQLSSNFGYIDDTTMVVEGDSAEENCTRLAAAFKDTCDPWARTHASVFAPERFALVHFQPPGKKSSEPSPADPQDAHRRSVDRRHGRIVRLERSSKLLGVILDHDLSFEEHMA
ncbi:uncharacterized protein CDV56_106917 [Aspergillus thermomutatus]|uniref:Reverse transcriptase domain-containing protein n=1 Tax=Aspergillus thermomutatus TaxID=41047 RepID=A0A397GRA5_ASPTH|nr:uncharacterized protein CDV56_106917 [Aspergillus thermomutatus]RHZ51563.1 hypothetical protein CDV56_106917 [Aspergillus thermomutatus]